MFIKDTAKVMTFYMIIAENTGGLTIFNKKQR